MAGGAGGVGHLRAGGRGGAGHFPTPRQGIFMCPQRAGGRVFYVKMPRPQYMGGVGNSIDHCINNTFLVLFLSTKL